jgi:ubiquinone biosynthesis protein
VEGLTRPVTHILRLLKWGRILARHGALRGIETAPQTPPGVKRLCRIARFGTVQPKIPDYAAAFQAIGPAAVKLGQTLATRPDLVGEEAARNLLSLQDSLAPVAFERIRQEIEAAFEVPLESLYSEFDPDPVGSASIAQVHRAVTIEGRPVAVKIRRPGIDKQFARDIDTYEWAAAHLEALGGEATRLRPRQTIEFPPLDAARARPAPRSRVGLRTGRCDGRGARLMKSRRSTGIARPAR